MSSQLIQGASLALSLMQSLSSSTGSRSDAGSGDFLGLLNERIGGRQSALLDTLGQVFSPTGAATGGLAANGRNLSLFDPESAYRMMSTINQREVNYKAEFAEMSAMKSNVERLQQEAGKLGTIDGDTALEDIRSHLQGFVATYNAWIDRFDEVLAKGGLLADTQAATVAQSELEISIKDLFNGAANGVRGMGALGLSIEEPSNFARLDGEQLDQMLSSNFSGAISAIQQFSANFARSAELLNAEDNFIPNRLDNLSRVIDYIDTHLASLQTEFGRGDPARASGDTARALASYQAMQKSAA